MARLICAALLVSLMLPWAARANDNGDMFVQDGLATPNHPPISANRGNGPDMLQPSNPYRGSGNDVFPNNAQPNPGIENEFSPHNDKAAPYGPLFGPRDTPPP